MLIFSLKANHYMHEKYWPGYISYTAVQSTLWNNLCQVWFFWIISISWFKKEVLNDMKCVQCYKCSLRQGKLRTQKAVVLIRANGLAGHSLDSTFVLPSGLWKQRKCVFRRQRKVIVWCGSRSEATPSEEFMNHSRLASGFNTIHPTWRPYVTFRMIPHPGVPILLILSKSDQLMTWIENQFLSN